MTTKDTLSLDQLAHQIAKQYPKKEDLLGEGGIFQELFRRTLQSALDGELTHHLGYDKHTRCPERDNKRNGYHSKQIKSSQGALDIKVPRDRQAAFEPEILPKYQTRFQELDDKIIALYARGLSTRDIQDQLKEIYKVDVSPTLISTVTAAVLEEVKEWQSRPLDRLYPIVYLDCLVVKVKEETRIVNKAVYLALGINSQGQKELLGMWISLNEGAKFWLSVLTDLKNRGLEEVFIFCTDGLTGFPDAIEAVYPHAKVQLCMVHLVRNSLKYVSWKDRKALCHDLKQIYGAKTVLEAEVALEIFSQKWDSKYPSIGQLWSKRWGQIITFFDYPSDIRKVIYTTNAIESLNMTLRKVIKNKRVFPTDESVFKVLYLAIHNISKKWSMPIKDWKMAMNRFAIEFGDRISL